LIDVVFLKATSNQRCILVVRGGKRAKLSDKISYTDCAAAILSIFGAVAVSQTSSAITNGIKGLPTFDTRIVTL